MTTEMILQFLQDNPGVSAGVAARRLRVKRSQVEAVARKNGIEFPKSSRELFCVNAPEACFSCPFKECKNGNHLTRAETQFVENALGRKELTGKNKKTKGAKKRDQ